MLYTLAQAEAFYWVARLGSFRAAATHLNLTQPTISLRVKELERVLGSPLFDRTRYKPMPTVLANSILGDVERMLAQAALVEQRARGVMGGQRTLRIGAAETFATCVLPGILAELAREREDLQITITVDISTQLERQLAERAIDIAFLTDARADERMRIVPLWRIDYVWVVARSLRLATERATPETLADLSIFTTSQPSAMHTTVLRWFGTRGVVPRRLNACNAMPVLARITSAGTGVALMPRAIFEIAAADLPLRTLEADPPVPAGDICAAWHEGAPEAKDCAYITALARRLIGEMG